MGQVTCKVPATLKPAAEAPVGQGVFEASFSGLEQALVDTSNPAESFDNHCPENILR